MRPPYIIASLLPALILCACLPPSSEYVDLQTRNMDVGDAQSVTVQMDRGELVILGTEDGQITVGGQAIYPDEVDFDVSSSDGQIVVVIRGRHDDLSRDLTRVKLTVPNRVKVKVESDAASVVVRGYSGEIVMALTSGDIFVEDAEGNLILGSNRGNITVQKSVGDISMVSNYGTLTVQDSKGEIGVSTIMGMIIFSGMIGDHDTVNLETDHAPIEVNLKSDSSLHLFVNSTSGDVACMIPDISSTPRSCEGQVGTGGGTLNIRTVSGAVTIRLMP